VWQHFELIRKSGDDFKLDELNQDDTTTVFHGGYNAATIAKNSPGIFGMARRLFPARGGMSVTGM
jgi:hypothetical protein